jgi:ethanolamine permease
MEYVITPAVVVSAMGFLMHDIVKGLFDVAGAPVWNSPITWMAIFYVIFVGINISGIEATMRFTVIVNIVALSILGVFFIAALASGKFDTANWTDIPPGPGGSTLFPKGLGGIFPAIPFAIWFFLAIEELPLAAEESMDPRRDIPRATIWGMTTLVITAALTLFLNTGVVPASQLGVSATPLFDGFKAIFGEGTSAELLGLIGLFGLIASFFTIIYAYGRNTYSLSRAGYFPKWLSLTHGTRKTPHVALIAGAIVGYALAVLMYWLGQQGGEFAGKVVGALLYMAVFGAVISYAMQCLSFILLRQKMPHIERPYRSPVGEWGAAIAGIIAIVSLISLYGNADYRPGVVGTLVYFVLGLLYFAIFGRHRLVLSPEEEFALTKGERGIPDEAGFVASREEQEAILRGESGGGMGGGHTSSG